MTNKSATRGKSSERPARPAQEQRRQPGRQRAMEPRPESRGAGIVGSGRLAAKVALITGGDSGIGRAVALAFAREGADVAIAYLEEMQDAEDTRRAVEELDRRCVTIKGDVGMPSHCEAVVERTIESMGRLDVLVNNAAEQHPEESPLDVRRQTLERTFRTNVFAMFYLVRESLEHLKAQPGAAIINTASVTAYRGSPGLLAYSASKGAIVSFTRSLSQALVEDGIRVNAVAPGPIWTPLIPATLDADDVATFGSDVPMGRAGEPWECAECYVFLASAASAYMTGQVLHPNGGEIING